MEGTAKPHTTMDRHALDTKLQQFSDSLGMPAQALAPTVATEEAFDAKLQLLKSKLLQRLADYEAEDVGVAGTGNAHHAHHADRDADRDTPRTPKAGLLERLEEHDEDTAEQGQPAEPLAGRAPLPPVATVVEYPHEGATTT